MDFAFKPTVDHLAKDNLKYIGLLPDTRRLAIHQNRSSGNPNPDMIAATKEALRAAAAEAIKNEPEIQAGERTASINVRNEGEDKAITRIWELIKSQSLFKIASLVLTNLAQLLNGRHEQLKNWISPAVQELHKGLPDASWQVLKQAYANYEKEIDERYNGKITSQNPLARGGIENDFALTTN